MASILETRTEKSAQSKSSNNFADAEKQLNDIRLPQLPVYASIAIPEKPVAKPIEKTTATAPTSLKTVANDAADGLKTPDQVLKTPIDAPRIHDPKVFIDMLTGNTFAQIDSTNKGYVTKDDLSKYIQNAATPNENKAAAFQLLKHYDAMTHLLSDSLDIKSVTLSEQITKSSLFGEDKYPLHGGISERSIKSIANLYNKDMENKVTTGARIGQAVEDTVYTVTGALCAAAAVSATIADPEPFTKFTLALGTATFFGQTVMAGADLFGKPASTTLRKEFETRQKMLDSWKFFDQAAL